MKLSIDCVWLIVSCIPKQCLCTDFYDDIIDADVEHNYQITIMESLHQQKASWDVWLSAALNCPVLRTAQAHDRLFCDAFIISHFTAVQNGNVKHLQGDSIEGAKHLLFSN